MGQFISLSVMGQFISPSVMGQFIWKPFSISHGSVHLITFLHQSWVSSFENLSPSVTGQFIWKPLYSWVIHKSFSVVDEGYSRNVSCALNLIFTFLLHYYYKILMLYCLVRLYLLKSIQSSQAHYREPVISINKLVLDLWSIWDLCPKPC